MKILNPRQLPESIVNAATQEERTFRPDRIGVTTLIGPAYIRKLMREHDPKIEVEVEDRAGIIIGIALASFLEGHAPSSSIAEKKISIEIDGMTITGIPDIHEADKLYDYKYTSVWSYIYGKKEWIQQLNVYAYMLGLNGIPVNEVAIIAFFGDWKWRESLRNPDYPQKRIVQMPIVLWPVEDQHSYIMERLDAHKKESPCTPEERWRKEDTYAVMKEGRKTAMRVLSSFEEASQWCESNKTGKGISIVKREGEDTRCLQYCPVSKYCDVNRYRGEEGVGLVEK